MTGDQAGGFVFSELRNSAGVAFVTREWLADECINEEFGLVDGVLASTDRNQVRVVVLAGEQSSGDAPDQCRAGADDLIRGYLFAVAGSSKDDTKSGDAARQICNCRSRRTDAKAGVVVECVVCLWSMIDDLMAGGPKMFLEVFAELEPRMIRGDVNAHDLQLR